jgi:hypothetical protein
MVKAIQNGPVALASGSRSGANAGQVAASASET